MEQFRICKNCDFSGVYAIVNVDNHKVYIGSSRNVKSRLYNHSYLLKIGKHQNKEMQFDYNNGDAFECKVISKVPLYSTYNKDRYLHYYERIAISLLDSGNPQKGYNKKDTDEDISILNNIARFKAEMEV